MHYPTFFTKLLLIHLPFASSAKQFAMTKLIFENTTTNIAPIATKLCQLYQKCNKLCHLRFYLDVVGIERIAQLDSELAEDDLVAAAPAGAQPNRTLDTI